MLIESTIKISLQDVIEAVVEKYAKNATGTIIVSSDIYIPDKHSTSHHSLPIDTRFHFTVTNKDDEE